MYEYELGFGDFINKENNKKYFEKLFEYMNSHKTIGHEILDGSHLNMDSGSFIQATNKNGRTLELIGKDNGMLAKYSFKDNPFENDDSKCVVYLVQHTDLDGDSSAAMIINAIRKYNKNIEEIIPYRFNYNNGLKNMINDMETHKEMYQMSGYFYKYICIVVDVSMREYMLDLMKFDKIIWLDHHSTSFDMISKYEKNKEYWKKGGRNNFSYFVDSRFSTAYLIYSIMNQLYPDFNINPFLAGIISVYDTKQDEKYPNAYNIGLDLNQYYTDSATMSSVDDIWKYILPYTSILNNPQEALDDVLSVGKQLKQLNDIKLKLMHDNFFIYKYNYDGLDFKAIHGIGNSTRFNGEDYTVGCIIRRNFKNNSYTVSLYSDDEFIKNKIGLGKFCSKHFNGGGHPGAAGFVVNIEEIIVMDLNLNNADALPVGMQFKSKSNNNIDKYLLSKIVNDLKGEKSKIEDTKDFYKKDTTIDRILYVIFELLVYEYEYAKREENNK